VTDAMLEARTQRRQQLRANGYMPIPLFGKAPPLKEWQKLTVISADMIRLWELSWPDATSTGTLTAHCPALDLDILHEPAAVAVEDFVSEQFEERGPILVRIGLPPKRAILFRTNEPFKKIVVNVIAPNGSAEKPEKIELLGEGQQLVLDGVHPDSRQPYRWHGGVPWDVPRHELPYLQEHEAHQLVEDVVRILTAEFGYRRATPLPQRTVNGGGRTFLHGEDRWHILVENILLGRGLHDSTRDLAAMLARSGMDKRAAVHLLAALLELSEASHDERWDARYRDIPRAIDSAYAKYSKR
jgi:hypothetical protein